MGMTRKRLTVWRGHRQGHSRPTEPLWMMVGGVSAEVEEVQGPGEMHLGQVLMGEWCSVGREGKPGRVGVWWSTWRWGRSGDDGLLIEHLLSARCPIT